MTAAPPRISIVTPSYNQAPFLEDAMRSVLDQRYPNLEYVVVDGGSTDGSAEIIRRYEGRLTGWASEPDGGQYDAINKGFARTTGEIMAWLNSDDMYTPWAFSVVAEIFSRFPDVEWLTTLFMLIWDQGGRAVACLPEDGFTRRAFLRGEHLEVPGWPHRRNIQQESTFWRRSLWERAGGRVDAGLRLAGDFDLWARFFAHADLVGIETPLAGFRVHRDQKTASCMEQYIAEAKEVLARNGGQRPSAVGAFLRLRFAKFIPGRFRPIATFLGLRERRRVCRFEGRDEGWRILEQ